MYHGRVYVARVVVVFGVAHPRLEHAFAIQVHECGKADHRVFKTLTIIAKILPYRHGRLDAGSLGIGVGRSTSAGAYRWGMSLSCLDAGFDDEPEFVRCELEYMLWFFHNFGCPEANHPAFFS